MSEERDLANEMVAANGISGEAQRETRKQQAHRVIAIEMRKSASLATIDACLSELDVLLMTEMLREDKPDPAA